MASKKRNLKRIVDEIWCDVPDTNRCYQVSNYGRLKSYINNPKEGRIIKGSDVNGFKLVQITMEKGKKRSYIHKMVAEIWIPRPSDKHIYVSHIDGNLANNHINNLEWHTKESMAKKYSILGKERQQDPKYPKYRTSSKLKESDVALLKSMLEKGVVQSKIAKMFCISEMQVTRIKRGENWGHVKPRSLNDE